jgi:hypothetical protein
MCPRAWIAEDSGNGLLRHEPVLRRGRTTCAALLQQTIEAFEGSSEGELKLRFSNRDRLTVARDDGPEGFTIHQIGQPLIVGCPDDLNLSVISVLRQGRRREMED